MTVTRGDTEGLVVEVEQRLPMPLAGGLCCGPGELLALVGPSGAGKTSMVRIVAGLMRPGAGRVVVGGQVWCDTAAGIDVPARDRRVGLVFQHYALMPHLSALDNVALALLRLPRAARRARAADWLDHVQLGRALHGRRPAQLSGGQQQRVAVARALAREPALLLLDEPFSAVDQMSRQGLYRLLADLRRDLAVPIVLVTHDLAEARLLADRMVVMDGGRVLQQGRPEAIHRAPRNARVADLVGLQNRFRGRWEGPADAAGEGWLQWLPDGPGGQDDGLRLRVRDKGRIDPGQQVSWVLPGDAIVLLDGDADAADATATVAAEVTQARHLGEITLATLALCKPAGALLRITLAGARRRQLSVGDQVTLRLDLSLVHVMPTREPGNGPPGPWSN